MSESDFLPEGTPRGLPKPLPPGERILWQGAPTTAGIWLRVFHAPLVAGWFAASGLVLAAATDTGATVLLPVFATLAAALALLWGLAHACHRTTVYTLTDRRLVLHIGIALPVTYNLPFAQVEGAALHRFRDGSGDLAISLRAGVHLAYLRIWPHARPWRLGRPEPMLRSVPEADRAAEILAQALIRHRDGAQAWGPAIVTRQGRATAPGHLVAAE